MPAKREREENELPLVALDTPVFIKKEVHEIHQEERSFKEFSKRKRAFMKRVKKYMEQHALDELPLGPFMATLEPAAVKSSISMKQLQTLELPDTAMATIREAMQGSTSRQGASLKLKRREEMTVEDDDMEDREEPPIEEDL